MIGLHPGLQTLSRLIEGELSDRRAARIRRHIEKCARCGARTKAMETLTVFLESDQPPKDQRKTEFLTALPEPSWGQRGPTTDVCGEIESVIGLAVTERDKTSDPIDMFPGMAIKQGDTLRVLGDSLVLVRMVDGSELYLNQGVEAAFGKGQYNLNLNEGELFAMMQRQRRPFRLWTPAATLEVLGTEFNAKVSPDKSKTDLSVLRGRVAYENRAGRAIVEKHRQISTTATKKPEPRSLSDPGRVVGWVKPLQNARDDRRDIRRGWIRRSWILLILTALTLAAILYPIFRKYNIALSSNTTSSSSGSVSTPSPTERQTTLSEKERRKKWIAKLQTKPSGSQEKQLLKFLSIYSLAPGQNAKYLPSPYPECRLTFSQLENPGQARMSPEGPCNLYLRWSDADFIDCCASSYGNAKFLKLSEPLNFLGRIPTYQIETADGVPPIPIGDFISRKDLPRDETVQAIVQAVKADAGISLKAQWRTVQRRVIVTRGQFSVKRLPDTNYDIEIYGETRQKDGGGGGSGSAERFTVWLGQFLDQYMVDEANYPPNITVRWHENNKREARKTPDLVLKNTADQTGLTFSWEDRMVPVLFIEKDVTAR